MTTGASGMPVRLSQAGLSYFRENGVQVSEGIYTGTGGPYSARGEPGQTTHPCFDENEYGYKAYTVEDERGTPFNFLVYDDLVEFLNHR